MGNAMKDSEFYWKILIFEEKYLSGNNDSNAKRIISKYYTRRLSRILACIQLYVAAHCTHNNNTCVIRVMLYYCVCDYIDMGRRGRTIIIIVRQ